MMRHARVMILVLAVLAVAGCSNRTTIDSVPRGAEVWIDGERLGVTPITADLSSASIVFAQRSIEIRKPGYLTAAGVLDDTYDPWHLAWLPTGIFPPMLLIHLHPMQHARLRDYYLVVLDEDSGTALGANGPVVSAAVAPPRPVGNGARTDEAARKPPPVRTLYGRDLTDEAERTRLLRAEAPEDSSVPPRRTVPDATPTMIDPALKSPAPAPATGDATAPAAPTGGAP